MLHIPQHLHRHLQSTVADFRTNNLFPNLMNHLNQVIIPLDDKMDRLIWMHTDSGDLTLKDAYLHFAPIGPNISWAQSIWNVAIPPSKSFMVWRLFHNRLPTDENLASRGFQLPSVCSICNKSSESSLHLFLQCSFTTVLWNWHSSIKGHVTVAAAVIYIFNAIWSCRNLLRFEDIIPNLNSTISMISANNK
ncbi:unnamed protein product [Trifolium pratense]|uniref:Uncharacterized protein n=1 Tax=Trifolium pratense TaxID=57577 RepID=A0ACB0LWU4_TRIPR|nr:unnamed protein product [Trifolium pratense]